MPPNVLEISDSTHTSLWHVSAPPASLVLKKDLQLKRILKLIMEVKLGYFSIVWKLQNFTITLILSEIKIGESRVATLTNLEALNFEFYEILHCLMVENYQIDKIHSQPPKWQKWQFFNFYILSN